MPATSLSSLECYLPLGLRGGLAGGGRGDWARPAIPGVLCIPSPTQPSASPQLGEENPDLDLPPTLGHQF